MDMKSTNLVNLIYLNILLLQSINQQIHVIWLKMYHFCPQSYTISQQLPSCHLPMAHIYLFIYHYYSIKKIYLYTLWNQPHCTSNLIQLQVMDSQFPCLQLWPVAYSIKEITFVQKTADIWLQIIFAGPACEMGEGKKSP